jgi:cholesterol oxidase
MIGLLSTLLITGKPGITRPFQLLYMVFRELLQRPLKTLRLFWLRHWAEETIILLCMQALKGHLDMRWQRTWYWPFSKRLVTRGDKIPAFIPEANAFAQKMAELTGGAPMSSITEVLFNIPATAHILGGCAMGKTPEEGVVDAQHRVFGYQNMYVCDGSVFASNLGVNPSLSITALTERAMEGIGPKL